ncbi:MurR/RpiR family transcriptional regulator [Paenibacillus montanisoli]|uniref:Transcriptional regulator n=1 Tax=Paenibacillus montanisoli TaxID=2081970 RepID=A0A328U4I6_9BACL|nr:MurR/RpiR family transcriptional regulator [Paenibacillus montanisoli]RAP77728.1 transcriptional regulator [Paenibacillus montanisoli]
MKPIRKLTGGSSILLKISSMYSSFTRAEQKVADAVREDPEAAVLSTVTDLSEKSGVGDTSVIRFCRKLGFRGYHEFKLSLAQDLVYSPVHSNDAIENGDDFMSVARKITQHHTRYLQDTLELIDESDLTRSVDQLTSGKKIYIFGVGNSGITALDAHHRFIRIGLSAEVQTESHMIAMYGSLIGADSVVLGISTSGSTKDLVDPIKQAKRNGATIICLTSHLKSPITRHADTVLLVPAIESPFEGGALSTKITQIHLMEILTNLIMMRDRTRADEAIRRTSASVAEKLY